MSDEQPPVGKVEAALRLDIADLGELTGGFRRTFAAVSYVLAHDLDLGGSEDSTVTLARELRATLAALARGDSGDDDDAFKAVAARMSTPVRDVP
jgi:hypothetical protein